MKEPEKKWPIRELEALALIFCVKKLRSYLDGSEFVVRTDHESLQWLFRAEQPSRIARWALSLQEYLPHMRIEYRKGEENGNADFLSRFPVLASLGVKTPEEAFYFLEARQTVYKSLGGYGAGSAPKSTR